MAEQSGFSAKSIPVVDGFDRGGLKAFYYAAMRAVPLLQRLLPITRDLAFIKR